MTLVFVMLTISVLGMLSLLTSRNERRLGERSTLVIEDIYQLNSEAEYIYGCIDRVLAGCEAEAADESAYYALAASRLEDMAYALGDAADTAGSEGYLSVNAPSTGSYQEIGNLLSGNVDITDFYTEDDLVVWTMECGGRALELCVGILPPESTPRLKWIQHNLYVTGMEDDLWS